MQAIRTVLAIVAFAVLALCAGPAFAAPVPELKGRVNDYADVLSPEQEKALDEHLARIESFDGNPQFAVLTVKEIGDQDVRDYGVTVANAWGLGQKDLDNGLLILFVTEGEDGFAGSIETGAGLEGALPDGRLSSIYRHLMQPHLGAGESQNYFLALTEGLGAMEKYVKGEFTDDIDELFAKKQAEGARLIGGIAIGVLGLILCAVLSLYVSTVTMGWVGVFFGIASASVAYEMALLPLIFFALIGFPMGFYSPFILEVLVQVVMRAGSRSGGGGFRGGGGGFRGGGIRF